MTSVLKPKKLAKGDKIAIIAPSHRVEPKRVSFAIERLKGLGFTPVYTDDLQAQFGNFAGDEKRRVSSIHDAFKDSEIKGIFAVRGGSGAASLLDKLDFNLIQENPKVLMGMSDITALLMGITTKTGLVTFHGPVIGSPWPDFTVQAVQDVLMSETPAVLKNPTFKDNDIIQTSHRTHCITKGIATGKLLGGNLSVLNSMLATPYVPQDWSDTILFLEDVNEDVYVIERMLIHLRQANVLEKLQGIIFGRFVNCHAKSTGGFSLEEVFERVIKPVGIPALSGAMISHLHELYPVPLGLNAELDAKKGTITLLESAVVS